MDLGLSGKRAAVAASSAGLGFGAARALAEEGCDVVISGRDPDRLSAATQRLPGAQAVEADVATAAGAADFIGAARDRLGGIDILVPNAGGPPAGTFSSTSPGDYPAALEQNLLSTVAMCHAAVPDMVDQGWGRVVAITSISVRQPIGTLILSNTARAGVTGFLKTLATEIASHGVTVNSIQPGLHLTERVNALYGDDVAALNETVPTGTLGDPDDFGRVIAFLCSIHARFVTGAAIPVDGGASGGLQ